MKISRIVKNQLPNIYGYETLEDLNADSNNQLLHWVLHEFADGDKRFVPCTEKYFHWHRNEERNERRRKDTESRCMIPSKKFGLVKCRTDCKECPYSRTGFQISMDYMFDNYEFEFADDSYKTEREKEVEQEQTDLVWNLVNKLEPTDRQILKLFNEGKTDAAIAEIVKKSRSMVQERRTKLIKLLKEKIKKYEE
jgi:RNA polymerase sigma factor (sigma-70 family)